MIGQIGGSDPDRNWAEVRTLIRYLDRKMLKLTLTKNDPQNPDKRSGSKDVKTNSDKNDPQNTLALIGCVHNSSYVMMMGSPSCT